MTSAYPGALDALSNPLGTDPMNSVAVPHATTHANANDAIEAIQATLGISPQGGYATVVARLNAASYTGHTHAIADVTSLSTSLAGKAATSHTHAETDVTNLTADLASKPSLASTAPAPLGVAAVGIGTTAARADHVHLQPTLATLGAAASAITITAGSGLTGGGDLTANRSLAANFTGSGGDNGVATTVARGDHVHDGRYFTQTQANANFAAIGHNHNGAYAKVTALTTGTALPATTGYSDGDMIAFY